MTGRLATVVATAVLAMSIAGCGGTALGYDEAPVPLDLDSPRIGAKEIAFDTAHIEVPANRPFILVFENRENVGHNVSIYTDPAFAQRTFEGVVFSGPGTRWYPVPALAPGSYAFKCDLHPNMTGMIVAG